MELKEIMATFAAEMGLEALEPTSVWDLKPKGKQEASKMKRR